MEDFDVKNHMKFIVKSGLFLIVLSIVLTLITQVLLAKSFFDGDWPNTSTTKNFYKMKKDSIDVLFLGSSHCVSSFSPQEIYDSCGIRSYNLGTEQQSVLVSYYWLKEALSYQKPMAVVLDVYMCFPYAETPLNSKEGAVRFAIDPMRFSPVKMEAISAICEKDQSQNAMSYYNPLIRFHGRWSSLGENDFTYTERLSHDEMKGYTLLSRYGGNENYQPFEINHSAEPRKMVPLMEEYLDKIVKLCNENKIELILVKTPSTASGAAMYNCIFNYAEKYQLSYYDFNEINLNSEINYQFSKDNADNGHLNYWGVKKVSQKMAEILAGDEHQIPAVFDEQWENSRDFYEAAAKSAALPHITDIEAYLEAIRQDQYTIFIAVKDEASASINDSIAEKLRQLGLSEDLRGKHRNSYYAVISSQGIVERIGEQALSAQGSFRNGRCTYKISSAGYDVGNNCSIVINNVEYAKNKRGLNIVVYDTIYRKVVDSVSFDTYSSSLEANR